LSTDSTSSPEPNPIDLRKIAIRWLAPETWLRLASHGIAASLVAGAVWLARADLNGALAGSLPVSAELVATLAPSAETGSAVTAAAASPVALPELPEARPVADGGDISRLADLHTLIPTRPRYDIVRYTVEKNDTLFIIADKFNLEPETILWGNARLADNPNVLSVGMELNILPIDGALRVVQQGDTLENIARVFHGQVEDIVSFPSNELDPSDPQLEIGQNLIIPDGWRDPVTWQLPIITRSGRGYSSSEPGACPGPFSGPTGTYTFAWPANNHYLSGTDYLPVGHPGLDIAAGMGAPIYASDTGVIVFAGWSTRGYGNLIIVDHGNSWQTAYAHLSQINVACGQGVFQGNLIGLSGSTGNSSGAHLHFEIRSDAYGRVNPWLYLP
jgi:murein DD-endopeptidase MepM/ murein hydrolase activator NlpD